MPSCDCYLTRRKDCDMPAAFEFDFLAMLCVTFGFCGVAWCIREARACVFQLEDDDEFFSTLALFCLILIAMSCGSIAFVYLMKPLENVLFWLQRRFGDTIVGLAFGIACLISTLAFLWLM